MNQEARSTSRSLTIAMIIVSVVLCATASIRLIQYFHERHEYERNHQILRWQMRAAELNGRRNKVLINEIEAGVPLNVAQSDADRCGWTDQEKSEYEELAKRIAAYDADHPKGR